MTYKVSNQQIFSFYLSRNFYREKSELFQTTITFQQEKEYEKEMRKKTGTFPGRDDAK